MSSFLKGVLFGLFLVMLLLTYSIFFLDAG